MKRKFLALFLTAALAVSVTACGSDDSKSTLAPADTMIDAGQTEQNEEAERAKEETEKAKKEAEEAKKKAEEEVKKAEEEKAETENLIEEALKRMAEVTSMKMQMVMNMDMSVEADGQKESAESVAIVDMECMTDPLKIKMEMEANLKVMSTGEEESEFVSVYADMDEDGNYMMYMSDGTIWFATPVSEFDLDEYNTMRSMEAQIGDTSGYVLEGTEKLNGADVYKYSYTMTGDEMKEAIKNSGALGRLSSIGLSTNDAYSMLDGTGEIVTYVYVDAETYYIVQYEMDVTEVIDALMGAVAEALREQGESYSISVSKMEVVMTCSNYNGISDITIPEEALSAKVVEY